VPEPVSIYTTATPFGVSIWTCSGAHIVNPISVKESETCVISCNTTGLVGGTYVGNPTANIPPFVVTPWKSDYNGALATSFTATSVKNGDGTFTLVIVAYYS
jgi:hypothetical protein